MDKFMILEKKMLIWVFVGVIIIVAIVLAVVFHDENVSDRFNPVTAFCFHTMDSKDYIFPIQYEYIRKNMPHVGRIVVMVDAEARVEYHSSKPDFDWSEVELHLIHPTSEHPSDRHAEVLNAARAFASGPTWYFDGDLFPIKRIERPKHLFFREQSRNGVMYMWPGLIYFPEFPEEIDFRTCPGFDTGGRTQDFLREYKGTISTTWLESVEPKNDLLRSWFSVYDLLEVDEHEQFVHVRNLTSNWKQRDIASDIRMAKDYLDHL
jgi:hypothetical protein